MNDDRRHGSSNTVQRQGAIGGAQAKLPAISSERATMIIEGTILSKQTGLSASFDGREQPYVLCVIARADHPEVQSEARIIGQPDIPQGVGDFVRVQVLRVVTDRHAGVVRFDCTLLPG